MTYYQGQVSGRRSAPTTQRIAAGLLFNRRLHCQRGQALLTELLSDRSRGIRFNHALLLFAAWIQRFIGICRHGLLTPVGYAQNFFHGSNAIQDLLNAVGMDTRAVAARLTFQFQLPSPFVDLGADGFSNFHHLVNPYPAPVAQLIAMLTAFSPENGRRIGGVLLQELAVLVGRDIGLTAVIT